MELARSPRPYALAPNAIASPLHDHLRLAPPTPSPCCSLSLYFSFLACLSRNPSVYLFHLVLSLSIVPSILRRPVAREDAREARAHGVPAARAADR